MKESPSQRKGSMKPTALVVFLLVLTTIEARSASFHCNRARSTSELLICADRELSKLDDELAKLYLRAKQSSRGSAEFKAESDSEWRRRESSCVDRTCLLTWYSNRRAQLLKRLGGTETASTKSPNFSRAAPSRTQVEDVTKSKDTDRELTYCLLPKAQYSQLSSYDGGKSAGSLLLDACPTQFRAWTDSCVSSGDTNENCLRKALLIAQLALKSFNK
jgi:uncharacterized protein